MCPAQGAHASGPSPIYFSSRLTPLAQTIEVSLRDAGYTVTTAATVDAARGLLEEVTFDVALLDLDLEDMRASELCHELRQQIRSDAGAVWRHRLLQS